MRASWRNFFWSLGDRKYPCRFWHLSCVMNVTAQSHDKTVIFGACSDAPHKCNFGRKEVPEER
jgi:hypothetical protein